MCEPALSSEGSGEGLVNMMLPRGVVGVLPPGKALPYRKQTVRELPGVPG